MAAEQTFQSKMHVPDIDQLDSISDVVGFVLALFPGTLF